ncbi:MAG: MarR family transcriptional regulator [Alphaproteobacteria bacterium]|nr:MarR family transcriptional regulator [Alphaproteobacteria bacterium]MBQ4130106.1 MarR family transcriptional regulator [Alphaproteobacteria bacterium]
MPRKEFVKLIEQNVWTLDRLADKLRLDRVETTGYPRQLMSILVRLHQGGRARLKDIARREHVSAPNLCAAFRKLERDGLVIRSIDEDDRRNTWYSVSDDGAAKAVLAMDLFRAGVEKVFAHISREDEVRLTDAMRVMKEILQKVELNNA